MPTPCVIRFTNGDGETQAFIAQSEHGHPEDVIINLSSLRVGFYNQAHLPSPGTVAAQFTFLDKLWNARREISIGNFQVKLMGFLYSPSRTDIGNAQTYLHQHTLLDSTSEVEPISYIYTVEIPEEGQWQIKIGEDSHSFDGRVGEVFDLILWDYSGNLTDALDRIS